MLWRVCTVLRTLGTREAVVAHKSPGVCLSYALAPLVQGREEQKVARSYLCLFLSWL